MSHEDRVIAAAGARAKAQLMALRRLNDAKEKSIVITVELYSNPNDPNLKAAQAEAEAEVRRAKLALDKMDCSNPDAFAMRMQHAGLLEQNYMMALCGKR